MLTLRRLSGFAESRSILAAFCSFGVVRVVIQSSSSPAAGTFPPPHIHEFHGTLPALRQCLSPAGVPYRAEELQPWDHLGAQQRGSERWRGAGAEGTAAALPAGAASAQPSARRQGFSLVCTASIRGLAQVPESGCI